MNCTNHPNSVTINDLIRKTVRAEVECGRNWMGATAALADWLEVSPQIVRMRYRDEVTGPPRRSGIVEGCWRFLAYIQAREEVWLERLARDIELRREELQLSLPLEPMNGKNPLGGDARRVARAEVEMASAKKAMAAVRRTRREVK